MTREISLGNLIVPIVKPQKGVDYYTEAEKQEMISTVISAVNSVVGPQEETRQSNEATRQGNESTRQSQENTRQTNESARQTAEASRASAEEVRQSNETSRVSAEESRVQSFEEKMDAVDTAISGIHTSQDTYDQNATAKTTAFNENATSKTNDFNANATAKTTAYNENASAKIAEYDEHVHDYEAELATKVDKVAGKGLSTEDYTSAEKTKLSGIEAGAEVNVVETVKVNGTAQTVTDKAVNITVPTKASDLIDDSGHYTKPSGGIPKTDLSSDVQTSLGKADTALQEHQDITGKEDKSVTGTDTNTYDTTETYNTGDIVVQNEKIYKANQDNITGTFDVTKWDEISLYEYQKIQDEKVEENYKEITKLQTQVTTLKEITSQMPQVSDSGEEAYLADTIKAPFTEFEVKGHSEQETTEGKNLLNNNFETTTKANVEYTNLGENEFNINGTLSSQADGYLGTDLDVELEEGKTYTVYYECFGGSMSNLPAVVNIAFNGTRDGSSVLNMHYWSIKSVTSPQIKRFTFIPTGTEIIKACNLYSGAGTTFSDYKVRVMIYKGTDDIPWEKYTGGIPSPNPSYEQPVKSCGENVQLFDKDTALIKQYINKADGRVRESNGWSASDFIEIKPNTPYIYSGVSNGWSGVAGTAFYDENKQFISSIDSTISSFTTPNNAKYVRISVKTETPTNIKFEQGTVATPYSPYGCGNVNVKVESKNIFALTQQDFENGQTVGEGKRVTIRLKPNTQYTCSSNDDIATLNVANIWFNGTYSYVNGVRKDNPVTTITDNNGDLTIAIRTSMLSKFFDGTYYIQLELGSTATSYVPHEEQNKSIPTQQPMRSIGEVEDEFVIKSDGKKYERHWIKEYVADENLVQNGMTETRIGLLTPVLDIEANLGRGSFENIIMCNLLQKQVTDNSGLDGTTGASNVRIVLSKEYATTFEEAIQLLKNRGLKIQYVANNPLDLPCTQEQSDILDSLTEDTITYKGGTYISSEDEVKARIKVSGLRDLNSLQTDINNVKQAIVALGGVV